ncbi:MAG: SAM-dependent methyltransferase, partial [Hyphomicrobiales bacterium]|nr:SAM-dependent methyltransferase [Hyphomicrobiales bacterium]
MDKLLSIFLQRFIRHGSLVVTTAGGSRYTFGDGTGPALAVRFTTPSAQRAVLFNPELRLGEAYMDGTFVIDQGSIADVMALLLRQERIGPPRWALPQRAARYLFRRLQQLNLRSRSRR